MNEEMPQLMTIPEVPLSDNLEKENKVEPYKRHVEFVPKTREPITAKNFDKKYYTDKKVKHLRKIYWKNIELHYGVGISRDRKHQICKALVYDFVVNGKIPEGNTK